MKPDSSSFLLRVWSGKYSKLNCCIIQSVEVCRNPNHTQSVINISIHMINDIMWITFVLIHQDDKREWWIAGERQIDRKRTSQSLKQNKIWYSVYKIYLFKNLKDQMICIIVHKINIQYLQTCYDTRILIFPFVKTVAANRLFAWPLSYRNIWPHRPAEYWGPGHQTSARTLHPNELSPLQTSHVS